MKYTILINSENVWKESYQKKYERIKINEIEIEKETYNAFLELKDYLEKQNIKIEIDSGYRSIDYQKELRERLLKEKGPDYVNQYVALPGYSEHHTGLAIDIKKLESMEEDYTKIHQVLGNFGFILRYPKGKENITGYSYEPWHIRYVGKIPAQIIQKGNLTLEEYVKNFSCLLCINKPKEITSFDVVNEISHIYGIKRVGHTGTLDPLATGVMIVAIGKATKIVELLTAHDKEYVATAKLGYETDTYDTTGTITHKKEIPEDMELEKIIKSFQKTYLQEVPIYSAIKIKGKKLYDYAREKQEVTLPTREVTIKKIELLEKEKDSFKIKVLVTKGCYIRSLIRDIGLSLNTYATMSSLERTKQGNISIENTNTLEEVKLGTAKEYKIEEMLEYPKVEVTEELFQKIKNGVAIPNNYAIQDKVLFMYQNYLLGIYQVKGNQLITWKNFTIDNQ